MPHTIQRQTRHAAAIASGAGVWHAPEFA